MLFLHEVHDVRGSREDEFEAAIRDVYMPVLAEGDDARLLWYARQAHGSGKSYRVVTMTGVRDGVAWERLARRVQSGDLQTFMRDLDETRRDAQSKLLLPVYWSPLKDVDLATVPADGLEHELGLFMKDTGWPHAPLDDYIRFMNALPEADRILEIQACFQVAHGTHRRREAVLWQKVVNHQALLLLLTSDTPPEHRGEGSYMREALAYRDDWESRLLRTSAWSPLF